MAKMNKTIGVSIRNQQIFKEFSNRSFPVMKESKEIYENQQDEMEPDMTGLFSYDGCSSQTLFNVRPFFCLLFFSLSLSPSLFP